ncbi:hypothetical protein [uncultured Helicobacter sp.]|uniref:hypothetical protein n=1 Tax=uncultured Helicobacter sp. TaxID=175537 RepID=UPI003753840A
MQVFCTAKNLLSGREAEPPTPPLTRSYTAFSINQRFYQKRAIESKQLTESTTSKNLIKALPNINNSACASTRPKQNLSP